MGVSNQQDPVTLKMVDWKSAHFSLKIKGKGLTHCPVVSLNVLFLLHAAFVLLKKK